MNKEKLPSHSAYPNYEYTIKKLSPEGKLHTCDPYERERSGVPWGHPPLCFKTKDKRTREVVSQEPYPEVLTYEKSRARYVIDQIQSSPDLSRTDKAHIMAYLRDTISSNEPTVMSMLFKTEGAPRRYGQMPELVDAARAGVATAQELIQLFGAADADTFPCVLGYAVHTNEAMRQKVERPLSEEVYEAVYHQVKPYRTDLQDTEYSIETMEKYSHEKVLWHVATPAYYTEGSIVVQDKNRIFLAVQEGVDSAEYVVNETKNRCDIATFLTRVKYFMIERDKINDPEVRELLEALRPERDKQVLHDHMQANISDETKLVKEILPFLYDNIHGTDGILPIMTDYRILKTGSEKRIQQDAVNARAMGAAAVKQQVKPKPVYRSQALSTPATKKKTGATDAFGRPL